MSPNHEPFGKPMHPEFISEETVVLRRWAVETNVLLYQKEC